MISRSLLTKLYAKYWIFILYEFSYGIFLCHIFHQIPKVFYGSKNVQILWLAHPGPGPGPTLGIISPLAHITPFLILENYLWFPKFTIAYTVLFFSSNCPSIFCLKISHSSLKAQLISNPCEGPFGTYCYSKDFDFLVVPDTWTSNGEISTHNSVLCKCSSPWVWDELLEIKNYVISHHFYYLKHST